MSKNFTQQSKGVLRNVEGVVSGYSYIYKFSCFYFVEALYVHRSACALVFRFRLGTLGKMLFFSPSLEIKISSNLIFSSKTGTRTHL